MGSQTLEILRQGVWASLTGGWFYDPHQNIFCNAVHLYLWLFLLCTPFVTYLYFPTTVTTWGLYCLMAGLIVTCVKIVNLALHAMYDKAQTISDIYGKKPKENLSEVAGDEDGGIEMQVLGAAVDPSSRTSAENNNSNDISQANSAMSMDYQELELTSTIDLKVDVHRKNSSESSDSIANAAIGGGVGGSKSVAHTSTIPTHCAEVCQTANHRRSLKQKSKSEDASTIKRSPISEEGDVKIDENTDQFMDIEAVIREQQRKKLRTKLRRQISLDSEQIGMGLVYSGEPAVKLQRHRSSESTEEHLQHHSKHQAYYHHQVALQRHLNAGRSDLVYYIPGNEACKMYLNAHNKTPMRKDSNSTMSALQLPTTGNSSSSASAASRVRRHSNSTGKSIVSVRRIKSAALETCCAQPSVSNLSPHPSSVETIGGGPALRNPQSAMLPPPSKSLVRNPHLNLFPKGGSSGSGNSANGTSEPVYPIAEQVDERSLNDTFLYGSDDSDDTDEIGDEDDDEDDEDDDDDDDDDDRDDEIDRINKMDGQRQSTTSESDLDRPRTQSTDSDTENNGSRSPLLDFRNRATIFKQATVTNAPTTTTTTTTSSTTTTEFSKKVLQQQQSVDKCAKKSSIPSSSSSGGVGAVGSASCSSSVAAIMAASNLNQNTKSEDSGCPSSDCDQASASSKDMLLTKDQHKMLSDRMWFDFSIDSNNISVDVPDDSTTDGKGTLKADSVCVDIDAGPKETPPTKTKEGGGKNLGAIPKTTGAAIASRRQQQQQQQQFCDGFNLMIRKSVDNEDSRTATASTSSIAIARQQQYLDELSLMIRKSLDTDNQLQSRGASSSSASSSRRLSGGSYEFERPPIEVLHQTKDGWILQSSSTTNPMLAAARGDPPPLLPINSIRHHDAVFTGRPRSHAFYMARPQPKLRRPAIRHRAQTSADTSVACSLRDTTDPSVINIKPSNWDYDKTLTPAGHSSWDYDRCDLNKRINAEMLLHDLMDPYALSGAQVGMMPSRERGFSGPQQGGNVTGNSGQIPLIPGVDFSDTVFGNYWRHFNLPAEKMVRAKRFYIFPFRCFGKHEIKIAMDRLQLMSLFDRDLTWFPAFLAIILFTLVSVLGSAVLRLNIYKDVFAFIFCFVIAGSQYSLLKSVQPDAASPIHGFNKMVAYSRPIYFCLCSSILLLANHLISTKENPYKTIVLFSQPFVPDDFFRIVQDIMSLILLFMPIFFSLGLFPQINTFLMYILEQIDMHIFGGNAVCSLLSAFLGVFRSVLACCLLYGPVFGGLSEPRGTQHILFSSFCGLLIAVSYHLSRCASDFTCIWQLIKSSLFIHQDDDEEEKVRGGGQKLRKDSQEKKKEQKSTADEGSTEPNKKKFVDRSDANDVADCNDGTTSSDNNIKETELEDPLPKKLQNTVNSRLKNDFLVCLVVGILVFSLHCTTVFTVLQPELLKLLCGGASTLGVLLHYIIPQMRKHLPWLCFARPALKQKEYGQFEPSEAAKVMHFEKIYVFLCFFERNVLYPLLFMSALTAYSTEISQKFGVPFGSVIVVITGLKCVRSSYSDPSSQYIILIFSVLLFEKDFGSAKETFLIDYFVIAIIYKKISEFLLKLQFIVTYIAPWQITWGSAFHAFAQPFSVPHSAMLFLQAGLSAVLSTPLNPFLGSAIFLTSYVRPIKFWERDYNTRRIDHSNTRLSSQLDRDLGADDNNLNSIFYEHLTRSLQHSLCGDLLMGRWGNVSQGDCFVLASDYLNCLVHIIELGNGLCTFQMRGLEFRGTYCQQREVEAISEGVEENEGCCCCAPGHLPNMLSVNAMFSTRWLAWQVVASKYILEGYSISDNLAQATLQVFEFRKVLITYYVKSIIYYTIRSPKLQDWLQSAEIQEALQPTLDRQFVDLDPIFNHSLDEDFDSRVSGITRFSFCAVYLDWITFCCDKRQQKNAATTKPPTSNNVQTTNAASSTNVSKIGCGASQSPWSSNNPTPSPRDNSKIGGGDGKSDNSNNNNTNNNNNNGERTKNPLEFEIDKRRESSLVSLLLLLGLLARRTLATASHSSSLVTGVEFFLHGLHALFKGDFRITSSRDEWVFADIELLHGVVAPAVKMALKLHQDHFLSPDEYDDPSALYEAINTNTKELVISHEADPLWRNAVLRGAPNLLALRHVMEDGSDEYRLIRLTKRFLSFRVIKLNRECVRGLWAGQQQELIYLRNRNPERGSIQNAKQALRNIINSSCDQPIGYPIYVSPLTTSYAETNQQLCKVIGGAITLEKIHKMGVKFCQRIRQRCREGCSSGSATLDQEIGDIQGVYCNAPTPNNTLSGTTGTLSYGSQSLSTAGNRGSLASMGKPTSSTLFAGLLNRERETAERESIRERGTTIANNNNNKRRHSFYRERDRERRATLQVSAAAAIAGSSISTVAGSSTDRDIITNKDGSTMAELRQQISVDSYLLATISHNNNAGASNHHHLRPNSSFSSGHLGARNTNTKNLLISIDRKSKSEERQTNDRDPTDCSTNESLPSISVFPPPIIGLNSKVIIIDVTEVYDCLDLGRRIDVVWPNETMRSSGGRSSWKEWIPQEGMVGFVVHYWQPNHPDSHFRSNFNLTLFLLQIGDRYVPVGEYGVKEYNAVGADERVKIVHIPKDELNLDDDDDNAEDVEGEDEDDDDTVEEDDIIEDDDDDEDDNVNKDIVKENVDEDHDDDDDDDQNEQLSNEILEEKSEESCAEDYVLSIDHSV